MGSQLGTWSYGAQVSQPIFTAGALRGNLKLAESQHKQALIAYQQAIQHAFGDVSDALIGYQKFRQVRVRQEGTVADLQESVRPSNMRYKGGTTTYLEVLDGQRSLFAAELTLAASPRHRIPKPRSALPLTRWRLAGVIGAKAVEQYAI
jgi:outer membrane protein, multidrug efflux system